LNQDNALSRGLQLLHRDEPHQGSDPCQFPFFNIGNSEFIAFHGFEFCEQGLVPRLEDVEANAFSR
jgi:hypothetical protein